MGEIRVVATDTGETIGTITLTGATVTTTGAGGGIYGSLRKKMRDSTDAEVFGYLASRGWCNGPVRLETSPAATDGELTA